jgi:hypothetical protein
VPGDGLRDLAGAAALVKPRHDLDVAPTDTAAHAAGGVQFESPREPALGLEAAKVGLGVTRELLDFFMAHHAVLYREKFGHVALLLPQALVDSRCGVADDLECRSWKGASLLLVAWRKSG